MCSDVKIVIIIPYLQTWILLSIGLIISSVITYLSIRKSKDLGMSVNIQNLGMFLPPAIFVGVYNLISHKSFAVSFSSLAIIALASFFFSWIGNTASLKALQKAPNPGYSLIISKSYVLLTSILSVWLFNSPLTPKSILAIILIIIFSALIILDKNKSTTSTNKAWLWFTFTAFFAWGFLALTLKYLTIIGVEPTIIFFYLMSFVSAIITLQMFFEKNLQKSDLCKKSFWLIFLLIGISSTAMNLFIIFDYRYAPNPGYVNASNAGSIALVTIFSALLFKDELPLKKIIGVVGVVGSLILLFI